MNARGVSPWCTSIENRCLLRWTMLNPHFSSLPNVSNRVDRKKGDTSGGSRISPRGGAPTYDFAKFSQKLHEIERIWTPGGGGARPKFYYVDPQLDTSIALWVVTPTYTRSIN